MPETTPNSASEELTFALVVPALNEEQAIASTLRRALAARDRVLAETPVTRMTVVMVNDGSTDGTQSIVDAPEFGEVVKVRFPENRGYGAAIKAGFRASSATLVGFIDADGTCDPDFCVALVKRLVTSGADVVLACRLNPDSKMPFVRRIGNRIFAALLRLLSGSSVVDVASGYRVLRRDSLKLMSPLPNGLHFTPAMSCICVLDPRLEIEEVPLPYEERIGRSKLRVTMDGLRFLYTILFSFCCYSPIKCTLAASGLFGLCGGAAASLAALAGASLTAVASLGLATALVMLLLLWTGVVVHQLNYLLIGPRHVVRSSEAILQRLLHYKGLMAAGFSTTIAGLLALFLVGVTGPPLAPPANVVVWGGLVFTTVIGMVLLSSGVVTRVIWAVGEKQKSLVSETHEPLGVMHVQAAQSRNVPAVAAPLTAIRPRAIG